MDIVDFNTISVLFMHNVVIPFLKVGSLVPEACLLYLCHLSVRVLTHWCPPPSSANPTAGRLRCFFSLLNLAEVDVILQGGVTPDQVVPVVQHLINTHVVEHSKKPKYCIIFVLLTAAI